MKDQHSGTPYDVYVRLSEESHNDEFKSDHLIKQKLPIRNWNHFHFHTIAQYRTIITDNTQYIIKMLMQVPIKCGSH